MFLGEVTKHHVYVHTNAADDDDDDDDDDGDDDDNDETCKFRNKFRHGIHTFYQPNWGVHSSKRSDEAWINLGDLVGARFIPRQAWPWDPWHWVTWSDRSSSGSSARRKMFVGQEKHGNVHGMQILLFRSSK